MNGRLIIAWYEQSQLMMELTPGADLDLTARRALPRTKHVVKNLGAWLSYALPSICTCMTIDKVTRVKSLTVLFFH